MLANGRALAQLCTDESYVTRLCGTLFFLQESRWRSLYGVTKANLLFLFNHSEDIGVEAPCIILILEDCYIEMCDDNTTGRPYSFQIVFKTTGRMFIFAADSFKGLENWISSLTVASVEYLNITKQSYLEQGTDREKRT